MSEIKLKPTGGGNGSVSLKAPAATTGNVDVPFVLPVADGSAGQFIKTDGSKNLSFAGAGISSAQQFRLAADQTGSASTGTVITNWEEADTVYQAIGSVWSQSSGIFSCSTTGIYLCMWNVTVTDASTQDAFDPNVQISTDSGGAYTTRSRSWSTSIGTGANSQSVNNQFIFDVATSGTFRLRVRESEGNALAGSTTMNGDSNSTETHILFIRLGDT